MLAVYDALFGISAYKWRISQEFVGNGLSKFSQQTLIESPYLLFRMNAPISHSSGGAEKKDRKIQAFCA